MPALKLECFTNENPISSKTISLFEGFESEKDIAYANGVKTGAEAATKAFESEKIRSLAPILEALNDIGFSQTEARHATMNSLKPLLEAIMATVLPNYARSGFASEIVSRVMETVAKVPDAKITIKVPSDVADSIRNMLAPAHAHHEVIADEALGPMQARINLGCGFDHIDIDAVIEGVNASVQEFFTDLDNKLNKGKQHG